MASTYGTGSRSAIGKRSGTAVAYYKLPLIHATMLSTNYLGTTMKLASIDTVYAKEFSTKLNFPWLSQLKNTTSSALRSEAISKFSYVYETRDRGSCIERKGPIRKRRNSRGSRVVSEVNGARRKLGLSTMPFQRGGFIWPLPG